MNESSLVVRLKSISESASEVSSYVHSGIEREAAERIQRLEGVCQNLEASCMGYASDYNEIEDVLEALMTNPHINLGDLVYQVRDAEGLGWEGPSVKAWSDAVGQAEKLLEGV